MNIPTDYNQLKDLYLQQQKRLKAYITKGNHMRGLQIGFKKGFTSVREKKIAAEREFDKMLEVDRKMIGIQEDIFKTNL